MPGERARRSRSLSKGRYRPLVRALLRDPLPAHILGRARRQSGDKVLPRPGVVAHYKLFLYTGFPPNKPLLPMNHILSNSQLSIAIDDYGAEPLSVRRGDCEYLWQAEHPDFWQSHAPILFPICGRLFEGKYRYRGTEYEMRLHGFTRTQTFVYEGGTALEARFSLSSTEELKKQYPFDFRLEMAYRLDGDTLHVEATVRNLDVQTMPFAYGAHPGFNVPLGGAGAYTDYELVFGEACSPDRLLFSEACLDTGIRAPFPLKDGRSIPLDHHLFDNDAIFLARMADSVTLRSDKTARFVRLRYPDMSYLGLWHNPQTNAAFVCIEPWDGLPAYDGVQDDLETTKSDMFHLQPGASKTFRYSITFG